MPKPASDGEDQRVAMAERVGFEPTLEFPLNTLSKRAPSTTRPPLLGRNQLFDFTIRSAIEVRGSVHVAFSYVIVYVPVLHGLYFVRADPGMLYRVWNFLP